MGQKITRNFLSRPIQRKLEDFCISQRDLLLSGTISRSEFTQMAAAHVQVPNSAPIFVTDRNIFGCLRAVGITPFYKGSPATRDDTNPSVTKAELAAALAHLYVKLGETIPEPLAPFVPSHLSPGSPPQTQPQPPSHLQSNLPKNPPTKPLGYHPQNQGSNKPPPLRGGF